MNKDILIKMALELEPKDLFNLCLSSQKFNKYICNNEIFWYQKLRRDMPNVENYKEISGTKTYKDAYKILYQNKINFVITVEAKYYNLYNEEEYDYTSAKIASDFKFLSIQDIKNKISKISKEFINKTTYYGHYFFEIDGATQPGTSILNRLHLDSLTYGNHTIKLHVFTFTYVENSQHSQDVLNEIVKELY